MRAMAAEAEAAREARAKVIAAEGEHKASRALRQAAEVIMDSPAALQVLKCGNKSVFPLFFSKAEVSANSEQYFCGKQQHHSVPSTNRYSIKLHEHGNNAFRPNHW